MFDIFIYLFSQNFLVGLLNLTVVTVAYFPNQYPAFMFGIITYNCNSLFLVSQDDLEVMLVTYLLTDR